MLDSLQLIHDQATECRNVQGMGDMSHVQNRNGLYKDELYCRSISQCADETAHNQDSDAYLQNKIVINNFVTNKRKFSHQYSDIFGNKEKDKIMGAQISHETTGNCFLPKLL